VSTPSPALVAIRVVGVLAVTLAVLAVGWNVATGFARASDRETFTATGVRVLDVDLRAGRVLVERSPDQQVHATVTSEGTWRKPETTRQQDGQTLTLSSQGCNHQPMWGRCRVQYSLKVPDGVQVGLTANAGQLVVNGVDGDVSARVNAGEIQLTDLRSKTVDAYTDAGRIVAGFAEAPQDVRTTTSTGAIEIRVPTAGGPYAVEASADLGAATVDVPTDPTSARRISARTSVGAVHIIGR
jgi:hypothetical protein